MNKYQLSQIRLKRHTNIRIALFAGGLLCLALAPGASHGSSHRILELNLNRAVRIGAANHFVLKSIRNKNAAIRKLIAERWRAYLPRVGVSYSRTRNIVDAEPDVQAHELRLIIEQVIYDGGQRGLNLDLAKIEGLLAREDFKVTFNRLRLDIQKAYLQVLAARGKVRLNRKSLERANIQLKQTQREKELGFNTDIQVLTVAARLREIELALRKAINEFRQSNHDLKLLLNLDFEIETVIHGDIFLDFFLNPPEAPLKQLMTRARSERPEVKRGRTNIHRLKKEKEIAEKAWIPRVSVNGYVGRSGENFPLQKRNYGVNVAVTFPIGSTSVDNNAGSSMESDGRSRSGTTSTGAQFFDDLGYERRVLEARVALGEAAYEMNRLNNQLVIEVQKSYDHLREAWEAIRIGNGRVYFQHESLRLMKTRYKIGEETGRNRRKKNPADWRDR